LKGGFPLNIDFEALKTAFELMGFGLGGVFLVLFLLYLICLGLFKLFPSNKQKG
jgi:Na+-transporting methylmalonyl-CoA/oxaloacetate decarboxylase gamma subunit